MIALLAHAAALWDTAIEAAVAEEAEACAVGIFGLVLVVWGAFGTTTGVSPVEPPPDGAAGGFPAATVSAGGAGMFPLDGP